jgi:hypothetical protein
MGSVSVIRPAGQNGYRPIDLLRQHDARKSVRPGLRPERQPSVGGLQNRIAQALGAADDEGELAFAAVAQGSKPKRDVARGSGRRVFVADDDMRAVALGQQSGRLGVLAGFAALDLDDLHRAERQGSSTRRGPRGVVRRELAFRRRTQSGDAEERDLQRAPASTVWAEPTDQIFSML